MYRQHSLSKKAKTPMQCAHFGKLLLLLGANHVQIGHDFQPGYMFGQRKLLNLWNFERHRSHATRDRKRTAHVSTRIIERVSHRIRRLLSARVCRLLNVCLRRLSIGSESHLTVA